MFPLAHNYMAERMIAAAPGPFKRDFSPLEHQLVYVGSILPDFVCSMGFNRNLWHSQSAGFLQFCQGRGPEALALALGVRLHGDDGFGFDTFADEVWQGKMGWCFLQCLPYIPDVVLACNLPRSLALWKAHNMVEMAAELELAAAYPYLGPRLLAAVESDQVMDVLGKNLAAYSQSPAEPPKMRRVLRTMNERFSIQPTSAEDLAVKYLEQLAQRHQVEGGSPAELAALLKQIQRELKDKIWHWFDEVEKLLIAVWQNIAI